MKLAKLGGYGIGGGDERHSRHAVERLSALIGEKEASIVVAGALHLNGAMIAAAQRNEDGSYTDHGNLVLRVGEFFWQHIHDYDKGHTLGLSWSHSFGQKATTAGQVDGKDIFTAGGAAGMHDVDGQTKATVGQGDVIIGKGDLQGVNRDVANANIRLEDGTHEVLRPHFSNLDTAALWRSLPRDENGNLNLVASVSGIFDTVKSYTIDPVAQFFSGTKDAKTSEAVKEDKRSAEDKQSDSPGKEDDSEEEPKSKAGGQEKTNQQQDEDIIDLDNKPAGSQAGSCPGDGVCFGYNSDGVSNAQHEVYGPSLPSGMKQLPTIEVFARHVQKTAGWAQHIYTIFTDSNGKQTIIAGFPEDSNMFKGNLEVVDLAYTKDNAKYFGDDWKESGAKRWQIGETKVLTNDMELQNYLHKARDVVKVINSGNNGGKYDYDICITDNCLGGNSNIVQKMIHNAMGTGMLNDMPQGFNAPGINGGIYVGPVDNIGNAALEATRTLRKGIMLRAEPQKD